MLTITPIINNYHNKSVSFKAKQPEPSINSETPKTYSYEELSEMMKALVIADIVEQEVIPPEKKTEDIQNPAKAEPVKLEILPTDNKGWTELHDICWNGNLAEFQNFIKKHPNFDPNQQDGHSWSYIRLLATFDRKDNKAMLNILAANQNIDLDITDELGFNDLHNLCYYGKLDAVKTFVENHPDFDLFKLTKKGYSYIDIAKKYGHEDIADYLTTYLQNRNQKGLKSFSKHVKI